MPYSHADRRRRGVLVRDWPPRRAARTRRPSWSCRVGRADEPVGRRPRSAGDRRRRRSLWLGRQPDQVRRSARARVADRDGRVPREHRQGARRGPRGGDGRASADPRGDRRRRVDLRHPQALRRGPEHVGRVEPARARRIRPADRSERSGRHRTSRRGQHGITAGGQRGGRRPSALRQLRRPHPAGRRRDGEPDPLLRRSCVDPPRAAPAGQQPRQDPAW